ERGRLTEVQRTTQERLRAAGVTVSTAYNFDAAIAQLATWGLLRDRRATLMRQSLRHVLNALRDADIEIDCIYEATRQIHLSNGKFYRVPHGPLPSRRFERGLRSFIRKLSRAEVSA